VYAVPSLPSSLAARAAAGTLASGSRMSFFRSDSARQPPQAAGLYAPLLPRGDLSYSQAGDTQSHAHDTSLDRATGQRGQGFMAAAKSFGDLRALQGRPRTKKTRCGGHAGACRER
jgi:hypothetical protein